MVSGSVSFTTEMWPHTHTHIHTMSIMHLKYTDVLMLFVRKVKDCFQPADSHHKLVRWRLVTRAAIDGYSRLILYSHCATNNNADTVLRLFIRAVNDYSVPSRVRSDQGLENTHVARYMIEKRVANRRSMIYSTHNQSIWRDMQKSVTVLFYKLFYFMEDQGILDSLNK